MGLTYYFRFRAPSLINAGQLEEFLRRVEIQAQNLGFSPTAVLNVPFDSDERRQFSRNLGIGFSVRDARLRGVVLPKEDQVFALDPSEGLARLWPKHGVVLIVTDENRRECSFGFLKYECVVRDVNGKVLAQTEFGSDWVFQESLKTPDSRIREIVKCFDAAGYLAESKDEFYE